MKTESAILSLIPQRSPFVMVDELIHSDEFSGATLFEVKPENIFVENGKLTEPALVENIAQTAAARIGYICKQENRPVPVGYIAAVQNLLINSLPQIGQTLETEIRIKNQVMHVTIIEGKVEVGGKIVAQCEMKIFVAQ